MHTSTHAHEAHRFYRGAPRRPAPTALRGAVAALAFEGWRRRCALARGPRWVVTADRVVELAAWDIAGRCWRTEAHELHPGVALYQTPEAALRMAARSSCAGPTAADRSPAAAPTWLTRQWTLVAGLASIALRRGAGRCTTELRFDGALAHHLCWHGLDPVCVAPTAGFGD